MSEINLNKQNFEEEVINSEIPVVVDFWTTWCAPCRMLSPIISEMAEEYSGKIKVCKLNVDEEQDIAIKYNIMSIPTLVFFKEGKVTNTSVGLISKSELKGLMEEI